MHTIMLYSVYESYLICQVNEGKEITLILKIKRWAICIFNVKYILNLNQSRKHIIMWLEFCVGVGCCLCGLRRYGSGCNKKVYKQNKEQLLHNYCTTEEKRVNYYKTEQKRKKSSRKQQK